MFKKGIVLLLIFALMFAEIPVFTGAEEAESVYAQIRRQYVEYLTAEGADIADEGYKIKVAALDATMDGWLSEDIFVPSGTPNRMAVFTDYPFREGIIDVNMMYTLYRMADMCKIIKTKGSKYYNDQNVIAEMVEALRFINEKWYNAENLSFYYPNGLYVPVSNWALMEFHIPRGITDVCVLLYDEMTSIANKTLFDKLMAAVDTYVPRYDMATGGVDGANGTAISWAVMMRAVLMNNTDGKFEGAARFHADLIRYTNNSNGFNEADNACPYHNNVAYTLGYGSDFYESCATYLYVMRGTPYIIFNDKKEFMTNIIKEAVSPLIYKSNGMTMVTGRYLGTQDYKKGTEQNRAVHFLSYAALVYDMLDGEEKTEIGKILKYHVQSLMEYGPQVYMDMVTLKAYNIFTMILKDDSLNGYVQDFDQAYPRMARVVHLRPEYGVGLAMMSKDTKAVEMSPENLKGWHSGSGMLYVYTSDIEHYAHTYKATVDPMRLSGVTVENGLTFSNNVFNKSNIANGAVLNNRYSAIAFQYNKPVDTSNLVADKSYFMFDKEIVCIGSDITASSSKAVETTVDNRMLAHDNSNVITVDGISKGKTFNETVDATWAHMGGVKAGSDMGYYFPQRGQLNLIREARTGRFSDICSEVGVSKEPFTENFLTMYFSHGVNPNNATYQYVLLPTMSKEQTVAYAANPKVEIINSDREIHAVKQKELNITAATFYGANGGTIQNNFITSDKPSSVMVREDDNAYYVSIADISRENGGTIVVTLPIRGIVGTCDKNGVRVESIGGSIILTADVSDRTGLSKTVTLCKTLDGFSKDGVTYDFEDGKIGAVATEGVQYATLAVENMPATASPALKLTSKGLNDEVTDFENGTAGSFTVTGGGILGNLPDGRAGKAFQIKGKSLLKKTVSSPTKVSAYIYDPGPGTKLNAVIIAQQGSSSFQFGAFSAQASSNYNSLNNYTYRSGSWYDSGVPRRKGWVKLEYTVGSATVKPVVVIDGKTLTLPNNASTYPYSLNELMVGDTWGANVDSEGFIDDVVVSYGGNPNLKLSYGVPIETEEEVIYSADLYSDYSGANAVYPFIVTGNLGESLVKVGISNGKLMVNDKTIEGSNAKQVNKIKAVVCTAESRVEVFLNENSVYTGSISSHWASDLKAEVTEVGVVYYMDNIKAALSGNPLQEAVAPKRDEVVLNQVKGWNLWLDEAKGLYEDSNCTWKTDKLYLPNVLDFSKADGVYSKTGTKLSVNEPTGGFSTLFDSDNNAILPQGKAKQITLPSTVEEQFGTGDVNWGYHGVSWFYKTIEISSDKIGKTVKLNIENARQRTEIYVNGSLAGYDIIAETAYTADITKNLTEGKNQIAIRITNPGAGESNAYNGGNNRGWQDFYWTKWGENSQTGEGFIPPSHDFTGIGGNVTLSFTDQNLFIGNVFVKNLNDPSYRKVEVQAQIQNKAVEAKTAHVETAIYWHNGDTGKPDGRPLYHQTAENQSFAPKQGVDLEGYHISTWSMTSPVIADAALWDISHPNLYDCVVTLKDDSGNILDTVTTTFGFRVFEVKNGVNGQPDFFVNGNRIILKSAIDWGYYAFTGMYPTKDQAERSIQNARELGLNSINQHRKIGSPLILNMADEKGLYIYEEPGGFQAGYGPEGLDITTFPWASEYIIEKVKRMTIRDRNHPSLIIYNMCNESNGWLDNKGVPSALVPNAATKSTRAEAMKMVAGLDGTRLVQNTSGAEFTSTGKGATIAHIKPYGVIPTDINSFDTNLVDNHNAAGGVRFDEENIKSFNQTANNTGKIVYHGEVRAFPGADNWYTTYQNKSNYEAQFSDGRIGYDAVQYKGLHDKIDAYYNEHSFSDNITGPEDLSKMAGNARMYTGGRLMQQMLSYNDVDGFAINGWSSQAPVDGWDGGYSGLVDEDRNIKGETDTMAYYTRPVQIAIFRQNGKYITPGSSAIFRMALINDPSNTSGEATLAAGNYTYKIRLQDGNGKDLECIYTPKTVIVQGGDVYAQEIEKALSIPADASWKAGYITVIGELYDASNRLVADGKEQFLLQNRYSYWGSMAPLNGAVYNWTGAEKALKDAGITPKAYDNSLANLDFIAAGGTAGDITALLNKVKEDGTTLVVNLNDSWADALTRAGVLKEKPSVMPCTQHGSWAGNGFGYLDTFTGDTVSSGDVVTLSGWEVPGSSNLVIDKGNATNPTGASLAYMNKIDTDTRVMGFAPFSSDYATKSYGSYFARKADPSATAWYGLDTNDDILRTLVGEISYGNGRIILAPAYPVDLNNAFSDMLFYNMLFSSGDGTVLEPDYTLDSYFFGKWSNDQWITKGILDYDHMMYGEKVLNNVEIAAKIGDYAVAKEALLQVAAPIELSNMSISYVNGVQITSDVLVADTNKETAIPIFAPDGATVTLNGKVIPYEKDGEYIYAVGPAKEVFLYDGFEGGSPINGRVPEKGQGTWKAEIKDASYITCVIKSDKGYNGSTSSLLFDSYNTSTAAIFSDLPTSGDYTVSMQIYDENISAGISNFTINFNSDRAFVGFTTGLIASNYWRCRTTAMGGGQADLTSVDGYPIPRKTGWNLLEIKVKDGIGTVFINGTETNFKEPYNSITLMQRSGWWNNQAKNKIYVDDVSITKEMVLPCTFALGEVTDTNASVMVTPNTAFIGEYIALVALCRGEELLSVRLLKKEELSEASEVSFLLPEDKKDLKIKCMVWNGIAGIQPLKKARTFLIGR